MAEQIRAAHILISTERRDKADALEAINALKAEIDDGADFGEKAQQASDCPSGTRGGDLGMFGKGMMVPEFEQAAFALAPKGLSDVVETDFGYHLIMRTE